MKRFIAAIAVSFSGLCSAVTPLYSNNFESGALGSEWSGAGTVQASQGFAAFGGFGQWQLKNDGNSASVLSISGIPAHSDISLFFSLAAWDNLDPAVDSFVVRLDGAEILASALGLGTGPGFKVAAPVVSFGYGSAVDHAFVVDLTMAHSADALVLEFANPTAGTNAGSFGLDNFAIGFTPAAPVPEPGTLLLAAGGLLAVALRRRAASARRSCRR